MYNVLHVITLAEGQQAQTVADNLGQQAAGLPGVRNVLAQPTLPDVFNGGDLLLRLVFDDAGVFSAAKQHDNWKEIEGQLRDKSIVSHQEEVEYEGSDIGGTSPGSGVYRVALFNANVRPDAERLAAFRRQTLSMPRHVKSMRRWQLSEPVKVTGLRSWTHVWEQEYEDLAGLMGPYMMHPVHWAHVERWFDTEYPDYLVDPMLVHTFCDIKGSVII